MTADLSIIIVSYNVKTYLQHCIASVKKASEGLDTEIFIVDNNSMDGSADMVAAEFPDVFLIANKNNLGFGKANNQALKKSTGRYVLFLNPDTLVEESTFSSLVDFMDNHKNIGLCGPRILNSDGTLQLACRRSFPSPSVALPKLLGLSSLFPNSKWLAKYNLTYLDPNESYEVDAVSGSFMFCRGDLVRKMGGFDEIFFMYGEDLDLCRRFQLDGYKIFYNPVTTIIHHKGESSKSAPFDSLMAFYGAMDIFFKKHFSKAYSFITTIFFRLGIAAHLLFRFISKIIYWIRLPLADALLIFMSFMLALFLRFNSASFSIHFKEFYPVILIYTGIYLLFEALGGTFRKYKRYDFIRCAASLIPGLLVNGFITFSASSLAESRFVFFASFAFILVLLSSWRMVAFRIRSKHFKTHQEHARKTLVIGSGKEGMRIASTLAQHPELGYLFVGFADSDLSNPKTIGNTDSLVQLITTRHIDHVIFSSDRFSLGETIDMISRLGHLPVNIKIVPEKENIIYGKANLESLQDISVVNMEYTIFRLGFKFAKRSTDLLFSFLFSLILSPLAFPSKWISKSHRLQFSNDLPHCYIWENPKGKRPFLYFYPMLLAVLAGRMSFVGDLKNIPEESKRYYKAGITNIMRSIRPAQPTPDEHERFVHYYMSNYSLLLDLEIIIKTLFLKHSDQ